MRRPRTLARIATLAVGAGIVANALVLQPGPHPAPFFITRGHQAEASGQSDEMVRSVQDALMQVGYYSGPLDGIAGPQTRAAINAVQAQFGHAETGEASAELLAEIRALPRPDLSPVTTRVASAPAPQSDDTIAAVQQALARSAYGPLTVDGVAGTATRDAIARFQRDHNLPVTGEVSDDLILELRADGALGGG